MSAQVATEAELRLGFESFVAASRRLETSWAQWKARAEAVDLELAEANRRLEKAVAEREALLQKTLEERARVLALEREVHRLDRLAGLSELALGVAHEIRNPLNGVLGFAELLAKSDDAACQKRYAEKIRAGVARIDGIVQALLGFARPQQGARSGLGRETVEECVRRAALAAGLPCPRVRVLGGAARRRVESDALVTVLTNLLRNSREASAEVTVTVEVEGRPGELVLRVRDDGPGVPEELGKKVLEPFVSTKASGHGLGLALASRVLSYLEGSLDLVNPGERGACFEIRLPCAAEAAEVRDAAAAP